MNLALSLPSFSTKIERGNYLTLLRNEFGLINTTMVHASKQSKKGIMENIHKLKILSTGSYVPSKIVKNDVFEKKFNIEHDWIANNLGIHERRISANNECTSDLASEAAKIALQKSGLEASDIDLIIVATATPDRLCPSTACIVQEKISAFNAAAFDISAVCSGFLFSLSIASQYIANGMYNKILLIGADTFSKITDWNKRDCIFFGDGAGAAIVTSAEDSGFLSFKMFSDGRGKNHFTVPAGGSEIPSSIDSINSRKHFYEMNGKEVYKTGTTALPNAIKQVLNDANLKIDDISIMIPHQPSLKVLKKTAEIVGIPWEKVATNMKLIANTAAGTVPILMDELNSSNKLKKDDLILFATVGSGWTYSAAVMKW
jgi:3-oxoacyl-[acyl-carrier-protein] synthase-3